ncbi:hypothetical protein MQE23_08695 [Streptomyces sp. HP-A2021]|uniref:hypothetical protein n=1 Tax=Streptomyces sp. HP-A2021 TaxID=2927875 RepID=UPI001FAF60F8|nr:hypothetical protein [Streptomyces sp. HP-A2021]UOB09129.1 hypothetical protein MQE23_08695 [Streptomyces sp. HP-A2021]
MNVRADVAELLRAGYGDRTIARQVGVSLGSVTRARAELGLPKARGGIKGAGSPEDLFWRRVKPVDGDHLEWTGHRNGKGTPTIHWQRDNFSTYRIAFRIRHGHEPQGYAFVTCEHEGCVAPGHIGDSAVTARPAHHRGAVGRKPNGTREEVVALIKEGLSDKQVGKRLRTSPKRVAEIRAEERVPAVVPVPLTFAERWAMHTEPVDGGHMRWTGRFRDGDSPAVTDDGRTISVRRTVFEQLHGRPPAGPATPGCGYGPCVRPEHLEDRTIRERTNSLYDAIFGADAA